MIQLHIRIAFCSPEMSINFFNVLFGLKKTLLILIDTLTCREDSGKLA